MKPMKHGSEAPPASQNGLMRNNWLVGLIVAVVLLNLVVTGLMLSQPHISDIQVPTRYTTLTRFDQLGSWQSLFILPLLAWVFAGLNIFLARNVYFRSRITSFMLIVTSFSFSLLVLQTSLLYIGVTHGAN
jgi:hypothetical protein